MSDSPEDQLRARERAMVGDVVGVVTLEEVLEGEAAYARGEGYDLEDVKRELQRALPPWNSNCLGGWGARGLPHQDPVTCPSDSCCRCRYRPGDPLFCLEVDMLGEDHVRPLWAVQGHSICGWCAFTLSKKLAGPDQLPIRPRSFRNPLCRSYRSIRARLWRRSYRLRFWLGYRWYRLTGRLPDWGLAPW